MRALAALGAALLFFTYPLRAQTVGVPPQPGSGPFTLNVNARLVFLDVTVLDGHNRPVTQGLTRDDFTIIEDHQAQSIFSFEGPDQHASGALPVDEAANPGGSVTEIVLDRLNSTFPDFAFSEVSLRRFLAAQPAELASPTELMLLDNTSFDMVHSYTRDRDELLEALDHLSPALPLKLSSTFYRERLLQSVTALREIAFRNEGIAGRKNVLWLGNGIGVDLGGLTVGYDKLKWFSHDTTNALVNGRISLFVVSPGPATKAIGLFDLEKEHVIGLSKDDPFGANVGISAFAFETGGAVLRENNRPDLLMAQAQTYGSNFYTLTYRPPEGAADGRFRRVMVKMRDPRLHAVTKIGYYAPDSKAPFNVRQQDLFHITSEMRSTLPLDSLSLRVASVVRHTDAGTVELAVYLLPKNMEWQADQEGKSHADMMLAAASLNRRRDILASRLQDLPLTVDTQDGKRLAGITTSVRMTLLVPRKTESIRVVMESAGRGRAGSVEIPRAAIDAARDAPTPTPSLLPRVAASR